MADYVGVGEAYVGDRIQALEQFDSAKQSGVAAPRQVYLAGIAGHNELRIAPHTGEEHLELPQIGVLGLVQDHAGPVQGASPHIGERGYLNGSLSHEILQLLRRDHIPESIVEGLEIGVQLVLEIAGKKAQALSRLHCRTGEYDAFYVSVLQGPYRQGDGNVSLAGAGRTRREDKVVVEPGAYHSLLSTVPGYDGLAVVSIDYGRLRVQHHRGSGSLSVEHLFHVIRREVHLVALYLYELLQAQLEFFYVLFLPLKQYVAAAGHGLQMRKMAAQCLEVAVCRPINAYRVYLFQRNRSLHSANIENYRSICTE